MDGQNGGMIGQVIGGRYRLTKLLGEGGMGAVYAAEHINITKTVAVKLLHPEISANEEAVTRFRLEAQSASSIGHPNIIGIDDFFKIEDGRLCLIMEFLKGESLSDRMLDPGGLTPDRAIDIVLQVCEGLEAAHEKGIIHRDMKPENVFLADVQGKDVVKILDFGIAKVTGNEDNNLTKTGTVFGTPHYMSPEQALGHKVDARADVYSVGVMLFEIFTGQVPFQAESFMGVLSQHITKPTPAPSSFTPGRPVPPMMDDIILTAMAKEVDKRFSTMNALKGALLAFREAMHGPQAPKVVTGKISSADVAARVGAAGASPAGASPAGASPAGASPASAANTPTVGGDNAPPPAMAPTMASMPDASFSGASPSDALASPASPASSASPASPAPQDSGAIPKTMMATGQQAGAASAFQISSSVPVVGSPPSASTPVPIVPTPTATTPHRKAKKGKTGLIIGLVAALLVIGGGAAAAVVFWDDIMGNAKDAGDVVAKTGSGEGTAAGSASGTGQAIATNTGADIDSGGDNSGPGTPDSGAVATADPTVPDAKTPHAGDTKHPGHKPVHVATADPKKPGDP
ncbi:MAG: serine/threonine protein kinase, partial [Deltaproteobacteria bacterium]|nr:serine/threonine protein kinase [Deltaproteobacteria bacterium]